MAGNVGVELLKCFSCWYFLSLKRGHFFVTPRILEFVAKKWRGYVACESVKYFTLASQMQRNVTRGIIQGVWTQPGLCYYLKAPGTNEGLFQNCSMEQVINALAEHIPISSANLCQHSSNLVTTLLTFVTIRPQPETTQNDFDILSSDTRFSFGT